MIGDPVVHAGRRQERPGANTNEPTLMKKNPLNQGVLTDNSVGLGPVTRVMVQARTRELAVIAGRTPQQVSQADYERAKRELTGEADLDRQDAVLDGLPEEKRWDPAPGANGHPRRASLGDADEDRSETVLLVDERTIEAERGHQFHPARAPANSNSREA